MPFTYDYPRPAVTADCVVLGIDWASAPRLSVLLVRRANEPFAGKWALPGGFVSPDESLEQAARRELKEETGLSVGELEQVGAFGDPGRDPRGWVVSVAYRAVVPTAEATVQAASDAADVKWWPVASVPDLAFDHKQILQLAVRHLRHRVLSCPFGMELLPQRFRLSQLRRLYEAVLGEPIDARRFRRRVLASGLVVEDRSAARGNGGRARWYRFDRKLYRQLSKEGCDARRRWTLPVAE